MMHIFYIHTVHIYLLIYLLQVTITENIVWLITMLQSLQSLLWSDVAWHSEWHYHLAL